MVMPPNIKAKAPAEITKEFPEMPGIIYVKRGEQWVTSQIPKPNWVECETYKDGYGIVRKKDYPGARGQTVIDGKHYVDLPEDYDYSQVQIPIAPYVKTGSVDSDNQANKLLMLERQLAEQSALIEQLTKQLTKEEKAKK